MVGHTLRGEPYIWARKEFFFFLLEAFKGLSSGPVKNGGDRGWGLGAGLGCNRLCFCPGHSMLWTSRPSLPSDFPWAACWAFLGAQVVRLPEFREGKEIVRGHT